MRRNSGLRAWHIGLYLLLGLAPAVPASAALGEVLVPAADRSTGARDAALSDGLAQVLVRLTGRLQASEDAALAPLLDSPARWAQRFTWQEQLDTEGSPSLWLAAEFDSAALVSELARRQVAVWDLNRPPVMLWLVPANASTLLARDGDSELVAVLRQRSDYRGLPVQLPLMDAQDRQAIRPADVRGHFDRVLQQAAARYAGPFHVAAVIYAGSTPVLRWRLLERGEVSLSGELSAASESALLSALVDDLTDRLAPRYRVGGGETSLYRLHIEGVAALRDWQAVVGHIGGLVGVGDLHEVSLRPGQLTLDLSFSGERSTLLALLQLQPGLSPCRPESAAASTPALPDAGNSEANSDTSGADALATGATPVRLAMTLCWQPVSLP